jgi:hypothetical protein
MKTRQRETGTTAGLPPPPAPPSRDANPWAMSGPGVQREPGRQRRFPVEPVSPVQLRKRPVVPTLIFAVIAVLAIAGAVGALERRGFEAAVGPILLVALVLSVFLRRRRRQR